MVGGMREIIRTVGLTHYQNVITPSEGILEDGGRSDEDIRVRAQRLSWGNEVS